MNKYKKLGKNTALFMIGNFAQKLLGFVFVPIYTAVLSTEEYGTADLIVTLVSMLWPVFTIVINEACFRFLLENKKNEKEVTTIAFWINIAAILGMLLCSPVMSRISILKSYYPFYLAYFIIYTMDSFFSYAVRGLEKVQDYVIGGVINTVTTVLCNLVFLLVFDWGVEGYLLGYMMGMLGADIWYLFRIKICQYIRLPNKMDQTLLKNMVKYSVPMIPNSVSWWINNSSDRLMVTYFCGVAANGIYSVAYKIPSLLSVFSSVFMSAWQISSVEDFGTEENRTFFSSVYRKYISLNVMVVSCIVCLIQVISRILFSKDFYAAYQIAPYLIFGSLFKNLSAFLGTIYTASKKTKMLFYSTMAGAILNIILNFILLQKVGVVGAAIATLVSYFFVWLVRLMDTRKIIKLDTDMKKDVFLYLILMLQILVWQFDISGAMVLEVALMCVVLFLERKDLIIMLKFGWAKVKRV